MNVAYRVVALVAAQMILIITSFLVIVYFESQSSLAGNIVNVAGKNRAMTGLVLVDLNRVLFHGTPPDAVRDSLAALSDNILLLREGDSTSQVKTFPLSERFGEDWRAIRDKFSEYEEKVLLAASMDHADHSEIRAIEETADDLIALSDGLTENLGHDVDALSSQLIVLQVAMCAVNVAAHIAMMLLVWRILSRHAREQAKMERLATIGEFASSLAHNLRNPLGAIKNSATRMRRHGDQEQILLKEADRIDRCIRRMTHMVEDVLNHVRTPPLALADRSVLDMLEQSAGLADIPEGIALDMPENDATILCDDEKLEVAFVNILRNAAQAMGEGGSIKIRLEAGGTGIRIDFANSGPAIPESVLPRIFEPLYTTKMEGTGLGLSSCQNIIEKHGGRITVSGSKPVTFSIHLPANPEAGK